MINQVDEIGGGEFNEANIEKVAGCLKALSHPIRLKILTAVAEKEASVLELVELVGSSQSNVSQHLSVMREKNILASRRDANQVFYKLGGCKLLEFMNLIKMVFR